MVFRRRLSFTSGGLKDLFSLYNKPMAKSKMIFIGLCLVLVVLIVWRYCLIESRIKNYQLGKYNDSEEEIVLIGKGIKEPDVRETNTKLTIEASERILITVSRYPEYKYGDELEIIGKLETPTIFDDFNYRNYLKKDGIYSVIYYPQIELLKTRGWASGFYGGILDFKDKFRQGIYRFLSPPQSEILGAMILGDKNRMSQELKEKLNIAGVRHITAVSGLHVERQLFIWRGIIIAAGIMLVINPMLLFYDVGFQLSFLAASGIISLGSILKKWLKWDILVMTVSAYVFTLPILIYNFGQVSLIGLLANLLIVPFVYWIMILGFIFVLIGLFWQSLAWFLSIPVWLLLTYIIKLVDLFSQPWLAKNIENIHWFWLVLLYLFLTVFVYHLKSREKLDKWT